MNPKSKMLVAHRSLFARITGKLKADGRLLRQNRRAHDGSYAVIDRERGAVIASFPSLEAAGRELGALQNWEAVG
jgi:hypothetical protein